MTSCSYDRVCFFRCNFSNSLFPSCLNSRYSPIVMLPILNPLVGEKVILFSALLASILLGVLYKA
ncbi:hypothetical protein MtrunA17_Chr6g0477671 [Medicago truncatula]|uniref:Transmembrane protein n=1 Tax=Medicago truncatula TaxID=3880 RepID=A0A396HHX4_MEDTR|nr:hypothetical protein MtrunA17_Chr6g0477671 [Medicago truncatula]